MWSGSHVIESRMVWKDLGSRRIGKSLEMELRLGVTSRDKGSSWYTYSVHIYDRDEDVWYRTIEVWCQGIYRKHSNLMKNICGWVIGHEDRVWTLRSVI